MTPDTPSASSPQPAPERVIDALYRVANFMSEVTDLKRLLTLIMEESEKIMNSEASSCMLYDPDSDELFFEVALGEAADGVKSIRVKRGVGFAGICLAENRTLVVNDVQSDGRHFTEADKRSHFKTRNLIATPMIHQGKMMGVLEVLNKREGRAYDEHDAKLLEILADEAAMAITNAQLVQSSIQRERLAAIGLAVSGIAHHLKNIIVALKGPLGLIQMAEKNQNFELIHNALPIMQRGSERMEQSVREMLAFSKDRAPELEEGNLNELLNEVVNESRAAAEQKHVDIVEELDEDIGPSYLDKLRLHDAFLNIVGNAVEALAETPDEACVTVRSRLQEADGSYRVEIQDNGPGIPQEICQRIFQPFYSTKGSKGTGLGLAVAKKVAEENGGALELESEYGAGAKFTFTLPIVSEPPKGASSCD